MPSGYSREIAKAKMMPLSRKIIFTQPEFIQCLTNCSSKTEFLLLITGFLKQIPQNDALINAIKNIQHHIINLNYDNATQVLQKIFEQPNLYIEISVQHEWKTGIEYISDLLNGQKTIKKPLLEEDSKNPRRMFESIFAVKYLQSQQTIDNMQKIWPDKFIKDSESIVNLISTIFAQQSDAVSKYWDTHLNRISKSQERSRGEVKTDTEVPQTRSPGILKSTTPRPMYLYDRDIKFTGIVSQSDKHRFDIPLVKNDNNWISNNPDAPLVASYSGHSIWFIGFLLDTCKNKPQHERQYFVETMLQALLTVYIAQGYHSYSEIMSIITEPEILNSLHEIGVTINSNGLFSDVQEIEESVFLESIDYTRTLLLKRSYLDQLTHEPQTKLIHSYIKETAMPKYLEYLETAPSSFFNAYQAIQNYIDELSTKPDRTIFPARLIKKLFGKDVNTKLEAATWLRSILTAENRYTDEEFKKYQASLNGGRLGKIFHAKNMEKLFTLLSSQSRIETTTNIKQELIKIKEVADSQPEHLLNNLKK